MKKKFNFNFQKENTITSIIADPKKRLDQYNLSYYNGDGEGYYENHMSSNGYMNGKTGNSSNMGYDNSYSTNASNNNSNGDYRQRSTSAYKASSAIIDGRATSNQISNNRGGNNAMYNNQVSNNRGGSNAMYSNANTGNNAVSSYSSTNNNAMYSNSNNGGNAVSGYSSTGNNATSNNSNTRVITNNTVTSHVVRNSINNVLNDSIDQIAQEVQESGSGNQRFVNLRQNSYVEQVEIDQNNLFSQDTTNNMSHFNPEASFGQMSNTMGRDVSPGHNSASVERKMTATLPFTSNVKTYSSMMNNNKSVLTARSILDLQGKYKSTNLDREINGDSFREPVVLYSEIPEPLVPKVNSALLPKKNNPKTLPVEVVEIKQSLEPQPKIPEKVKNGAPPEGDRRLSNIVLGKKVQATPAVSEFIPMQEYPPAYPHPNMKYSTRCDKCDDMSIEIRKLQNDIDFLRENLRSKESRYKDELSKISNAITNNQSAPSPNMDGYVKLLEKKLQDSEELYRVLRVQIESQPKHSEVRATYSPMENEMLEQLRKREEERTHLVILGSEKDKSMKVLIDQVNQLKDVIRERDIEINMLRNVPKPPTCVNNGSSEISKHLTEMTELLKIKDRELADARKQIVPPSQPETVEFNNKPTPKAKAYAAPPPPPQPETVVAESSPKTELLFSKFQEPSQPVTPLIYNKSPSSNQFTPKTERVYSKPVETTYITQSRSPVVYKETTTSYQKAPETQVVYSKPMESTYITQSRSPVIYENTTNISHYTPKTEKVYSKPVETSYITQSRSPVIYENTSTTINHYAPKSEVVYTKPAEITYTSPVKSQVVYERTLARDNYTPRTEVKNATPKNIHVVDEYIIYTPDSCKNLQPKVKSANISTSKVQTSNQKQVVREETIHLPSRVSYQQMQPVVISSSYNTSAQKENRIGFENSVRKSQNINVVEYSPNHLTPSNNNLNGSRVVVNSVMKNYSGVSPLLTKSNVDEFKSLSVSKNFNTPNFDSKVAPSSARFYDYNTSKVYTQNNYSNNANFTNDYLLNGSFKTTGNDQLRKSEMASKTNVQVTNDIPRTTNVVSKACPGETYKEVVTNTVYQNQNRPSLSVRIDQSPRNSYNCREFTPERKSVRGGDAEQIILGGCIREISVNGSVNYQDRSESPSIYVNRLNINNEFQPEHVKPTMVYSGRCSLSKTKNVYERQPNFNLGDLSPVKDSLSTATPYSEITVNRGPVVVNQEIKSRPSNTNTPPLLSKQNSNKALFPPIQLAPNQLSRNPSADMFQTFREFKEFDNNYF